MVMQEDKTIYKDFGYLKNLVLINGQIIEYTNDGSIPKSADTWIWIIIGVIGVACIGIIIYELKKPKSNNDG